MNSDTKSAPAKTQANGGKSSSTGKEKAADSASNAKPGSSRSANQREKKTTGGK